VTGERGTEVAAEYAALRTGAGAHWLARDVVRITGPDTISYLQGQLSQDVTGLGVGSTAESLILSPQGKIDALVRVTRTGENEVVLDTGAGWGEAVAARLVRFRMRVKVEVTALDWRCLAVRGPAAGLAGEARGEDGGGVVDPSAGAGRGWLILPSRWSGVAGYDILGDEPEVPAGVRLCGDQAWEAVRVEAGVAQMGSELTERTIPAETNLVGAAVSFTKGCFTGQELVARIEARGNRVPRHLRGVVVDSDQVPPVGAELRLVASGAGGAEAGGAEAGGAEAGGPGVGGPDVGGPDVGGPGVGGKVVGSLTSVAWSPGFGAPVALAFVRREVDPPSEVTLSWEGAVVPARVEALPLQVTVG